jgi:hypothetical protein
MESALLKEDEDSIADELDVVSATYQLVSPSGRHLLVDSIPTTPAPAEGDRVYLLQNDAPYVADDVIEFDGLAWQFLVAGIPPELTNNTAYFRVPGELTLEPGLYRGRVQFTTPEGNKYSTVVSFEARDPLEIRDFTGIEAAVDHAYLKLEDLFDSELGGPWLQDKTVRNFDHEKMALLLPDALYQINNTFQPVTTFSDLDFPQAHYPLLSQALLVESIYHLIRSYVEQPLPVGNPITYFDRRDYLARWQSVLTAEEKKLATMIDIFKVAYTGFGQTAILVGGYSTPITRMSRYWRLRNPRYIGPTN